MDSKSATEALQEAIKDYNLWAKDKRGINQSISPKNLYGEIRGVFYNKLLARMKEVPGFHEENRDLYGRLLEPDDFEAYFQDMTMIKLRVNLYARNYCTGTKRKFLLLLQEASKSLVYDLFSDSYSYRIASIVEEIKAFKL